MLVEWFVFAKQAIMAQKKGKMSELWSIKTIQKFQILLKWYFLHITKLIQKTISYKKNPSFFCIKSH